MNNLYNSLNQNNPANMVKQFEEFRRNFKGDPKQAVQDLLNTGKMTQEQYNRLQGPAQALYSLIK